MTKLFIPTTTQETKVILKEELQVLTERISELAGSSEITGVYGDYRYLHLAGLEIINNLINFETTNSLEFSPALKKYIINDLNDCWPINEPTDLTKTTNLYSLTRIPFSTDKVQFLRLSLTYLVLGNYNKIPTIPLYCTMCYDKILKVQLTAGVGIKNDVLLDIGDFANWCNKIKDIDICDNEDLPFREYLQNYIDRMSVVAMLIVLITLSRNRKLNMSYQANSIIQPLVKHFNNYLL